MGMNRFLRTLFTFFIQMDFPKHYGIVLSVFKGSKSNFLNCDILMSLKIDFFLANSVDPDEMQPYHRFR